MKDEITAKLLQWAQNIENVVAEELPSFAHEIVTYGFYANLIKAIVLLILTFIFYKLMRKFIKLDEESKYNEFTSHKVVFAIIMIILSIFSIYDFCQCIKAKVAPRLFVIEYIFKK